jgi:hypothetical protein
MEMADDNIDERERAFEKKYSMDQEFKFKV